MFYLKCEKCGEIFANDEVAKDYCDGGYRGEPHESCPYCGCDDLIDVEQCSICGKWVERSYGCMGHEVCEDCLLDNMDVRTVCDFGEQHPEDVEISGLFASVYSKEEINDILLADFMKLPEQKQMEFCKNFAEDDRNQFAEFIG